MAKSFPTVGGQYDRLSGHCQGDLAGLRAYFSRLYSVIYNDESQDCLKNFYGIHDDLVYNII